MQHLALICLLLYSFIHTAQTGLHSLNGTEGQEISIMCGNKKKVIWSKDVGGNKVNITTVIKKRNIPDLHGKYSVLDDLSLRIKNLTLSDSGIYYCNDDPVGNLTVNPLKAVYHVESVENNIAILKCGDLTEGKVTWSRDINGQKTDLLTSHNGEVTKHISDSHKRYSSGVNVVLSIFRVSLSDAGKYYCSGNTVELQVIPKTVYHVKGVEKNIATLKCGNLAEGKVTWSRDINGQKTELLTSNNGEVSKHIPDLHNRYSSGSNAVLIISKVSLSDAGKYYCSGNTVELQVIPNNSSTSTTTRTTGVVTSATTRTTGTTTSATTGTTTTTEPNTANKSQSTSTIQISTKLSSSTQVTMTSAATRTKETKTRATPVTICSSTMTGSEWDKRTASERKQDSTETKHRNNQPTGGNITSTTINSTKGTIVTVASLSAGVGLISLVLMSLLMWRCCVQTKSAKASKNDHVYESVEHLATSTTPACEKQCGGIYVLAGDPAVLNLVKKNQSDNLTSQTQSSEKLMEPMYYTIHADKQTTSDV